MRTRSKIAVGDAVDYSVRFLRSIGEITGDMPQARGTVTEVKSCGGGGLVLARVDWGKWDMPERVNIANLAKKGTLAYVAD